MMRGDAPDLDQSAPRILGLGSPHGDDQLGWIAVDRLRPLLPLGIVAAKAKGGPGLLECLVGQDELVIVDALAPAGQPGLFRSFTWPCEDFVHCATWSSHGLGIVEALRFAEVLGSLPRRISIETVEAKCTRPGAGLSPLVSQRLDELVTLLLRRFGPGNTGKTEGG